MIEVPWKDEAEMFGIEKEFSDSLKDKAFMRGHRNGALRALSRVQDQWPELDLTYVANQLALLDDE